MRTYALISSTILFCVAALSAEDLPNLTGVWKYAEDGRTVTYTIDHRNSGLRIRCASQFSTGRLAGGFSGEEEYTINDAERTSKTSGGRAAWSTAYRQGPSLVVQRVVKDGYRVTVRRDVWTLSEDRGTLTKTRRTINMDGVSENTEVCRRQE